VSAADQVAALSAVAELCELLDPDVMRYSADVDSNVTCNGRDEAVACIERNAHAGLTGHFDGLAAGDDLVVVSPATDPPLLQPGFLVLRLRDGLIVELRDFRSSADAHRYAEAATGAGAP
jgi:ketosteroid isomerase-like protein